MACANNPVRGGISGWGRGGCDVFEEADFEKKGTTIGEKFNDVRALEILKDGTVVLGIGAKPRGAKRRAWNSIFVVVI